MLSVRFLESHNRYRNAIILFEGVNRQLLKIIEGRR